jgi:hypothetical protein
MGNRAVITTEDKQLGVYLHWNGGRDSVEGFLEFCKRKGYQSPEKSGEGWARLIQAISNFMGTSVYVDLYQHLDVDNYDNGVYIIRDWKIVDRLFKRYPEQQEYKLGDFLVELNSKQPEPFRLEEKDLLEKLFTPEKIELINNKSILSGGEGLDFWEVSCRAEVLGDYIKVTTWEENGTEITELYELLEILDKDYIQVESPEGEVHYLS